MSAPRTDPPHHPASQPHNSAASAPPTSAPPPPTPPPTRPLNWVMLIVGVVLAALGLGAAVAGTVLMAAQASQEDGRYGYTDTERFQTAGNAITTSPVSLDLDQDNSMAGVDLREVLSIEVRATPVVSGQEVFIGVAPAADVSAYLDGVPHSVLGDLPSDDRGSSGQGGWGTAPGWDSDPGSGPGSDDPLEDVPGTRTPEPPTEQDFWAQSASGADQQSLSIDYRSGDWVLVVMNADGSRPVWVDAQVGVHTELLGAVDPGLLIAGLVGLVVGILLVLLGAAGLGRDLDRGGDLADDPRAATAGAEAGASASAAADGAGAAAAGVGNRGRPDPLRLTGYLDPQVSRWMWLVKWLLGIPHYIVLGLLWCAALLVAIAAFFAILFTGRYPRSWFAFTVGVFRWSWRVGFYAYSALGTDRYPPFTLARVDYPAGLDVVYPERLSRGLVLVKWWLLVIPQLLIVGIFTGGAMVANDRSNGGGTSVGFSLLGLLVLFAAIALLFTGRYPRGIFDLVVGLNRWVNRVGSYMFLLRDEYPPFRLDQGPEEPAWAQAAPSATAGSPGPTAAGTPGDTPGPSGPTAGSPGGTAGPAGPATGPSGEQGEQPE